MSKAGEMSRHLKNRFRILNNCLSVIIGKVTLIDVMRIGTGALFNTSYEMMSKLTMEDKLLVILHPAALPVGKAVIFQKSRFLILSFKSLSEMICCTDLS